MNPAEAEKRILENIKTKDEKLALNSCKLNGSESFWRLFEQCGHLRKLLLMNNQIADCSFLQGLTGLQYLSIPKNQITDISFLQGLTGLQKLNLTNNQITDISFLKGLTGLQKLYLRNNKIADISHLLSLKHLRYLDLENNLLADVPKEILDGGLEIQWKKDFMLHEDNKGINLYGNPLPPAMIAAIQQNAGNGNRSDREVAPCQPT